MSTIAGFLKMIDEHGTVVAAAVAGISPSTVCMVARTRELPAQERPRRQIESAVALNAGVERRQDLRFVP